MFLWYVVHLKTKLYSYYTHMYRLLLILKYYLFRKLLYLSVKFIANTGKKSATNMENIS